jgi:hypothetical protein
MANSDVETELSKTDAQAKYCCQVAKVSVALLSMFPDSSHEKGYLWDSCSSLPANFDYMALGHFKFAHVLPELRMWCQDLAQKAPWTSCRVCLFVGVSNPRVAMASIRSSDLSV